MIHHPASESRLPDFILSLSLSSSLSFPPPGLFTDHWEIQHCFAFFISHCIIISILAITAIRLPSFPLFRCLKLRRSIYRHPAYSAYLPCLPRHFGLTRSPLYVFYTVLVTLRQSPDPRCFLTSSHSPLSVYYAYLPGSGTSAVLRLVVR